MPLLLFCALLFQADFGRSLFRYFTASEYKGLPQNWAFAQDHRGVMYAANTRGLLEYDGNRWRLILTGDRLTVRSLAMDTDSTLWIGAVGVFGRLKPGPHQEPVFDAVSSLLPDSASTFGDVWRVFPFDGGMVFFTQQRLYFFKNGAFEIRPVRAVSRLVSDGTRLYLHEQDSLRIFTRFGAWTSGSLPPGTRLTGGYVRPDGAFLLTGSDGTLFIPDSGTVAREVRPDMAEFARRGELYNVQQYGSLVFFNTLRDGVLITDRNLNTVDRIDATDGLPDLKVYTSYLDRTGNVWFGLGNGLVRYELTAPVRLASREAGLTSPVRAAIRFRDTLYAATTTGLFKYSSGVFVPERFNGLSGIPAVIPDAQGRPRLFHGDPSGMHLREEEQPWRTLAAGLQGLSFAGRDSLVFAGHKNGILRFTGPGLSIQRPVFEEAGAEVHRLLYEPAADRLWASLRFRGLLRLDSATSPAPNVTRYTAQQGIAADYDIDLHVYDGVLWAGTREGFRRYDAGLDRFEPGDLATGGSAPGVYASSRSAMGDLYFVAYGAAFKSIGWLRPAEGGPVAMHRVFDVLPDMDYESVFADGRQVWISGSEGLVRFDPERAAVTPPAGTLLIRSIAAGADSLLYEGGVPGGAPAGTDITLPYALNALRIRVSLAGIPHETAHQFLFKLEGASGRPAAWTGDPVFSYANLFEGRYRLDITARDGAGNLYGPRTVTLRILPPWYRAPLMVVLYTLVIGALVTALVRYRTRTIERQRTALERTVDERTSQLKRSNLELMRVNRLKNRFLELAAHDLRNPLTVVKGLAEELSGDGSLKEETRSLAGMIHTSATRMADLVEELLGQADRKDAADNGFTLVNDLSEIAVEVAGELQAQYHAKQQALFMDTPPGAFVEADRTLLRSVVANLLTNASKYTPPGLTVRLSVKQAGDRVHLLVADEGQGLQKDELARIFQRFQKIGTRPTGGERQTGLGLSLTREIVEMTGGQIRAESEGRGRGTSFIVELPAASTQQGNLSGQPG